MESQPRLLDQMREVLRLKHLSFRSPSLGGRLDAEQRLQVLPENHFFLFPSRLWVVEHSTVCRKEGSHITEGQELRVLILSEEDCVRAALGDLVVPLATHAGEDVDEEALTRDVEEGFRGQPPLSDTILEERREGP